MLTLQNITYLHPTRNLLFHHLNLTLQKQTKAALIGNNGSGKSTLLRIMAGLLEPNNGNVFTSTTPYYVPQVFGQFSELTVAEALKVDKKLNALKEILSGDANETNFSLLNDDWLIEERCHEALIHYKLLGIDLNQKMNTLSGGQKTKVFLSGIQIHQPEIILLDEPSNHLDNEGREQLYQFIRSTSATLLVVSHDRKLLDLLEPIYELSKNEIKMYGGNYTFYKEQKIIESNALNSELKSKEKALRKAKETEKETMERQHRLDARGKKKQEKAGLPTISMKTFKNSAEKSTARTKDIHAEKMTKIAEELNELRDELPDLDKMKFGFDSSHLHKGKILITAENLNFGFGEKMLWEKPLNPVITSGERLVIKGVNGSGKTTLIKLFLGELEPGSGIIRKTDFKAVYVDQDYSLIDNTITLFEQAQRFNKRALQEHEIKILLSRFLFASDSWDKSCAVLSGGEKMRLLLCCLTISNIAPDLIILDEPTNNLDIQNIELLTSAIKEYQGTLLVISHDELFLKQIRIERTLDLIKNSGEKFK